MPGRLLALGVLVARLAAAQGIVAVLPLDAQHATIEPGDLTVFEEGLRTIATAELQPLGYSVLTGETTLAVLEQNGVDAVKACEASCALAMARELKASLFLSGSIATSEGQHTAFLRLFDAASGKILTSAELEAPTVRELRNKFKEEARSYFARALGPGGQVAVREGTIGPREEFVVGGEEVVVRFETDPPGAAVLVDGTILCQQTPCSKTTPGGTHEVTFQKVGYERSVGRESFTRGARIFRALDATSGEVSISSVPAGLPVKIDGRAAVKTPTTVTLDPGPHELVVDDPCWEATGERILLEKGANRQVRIEGLARTTTVAVSATDPEGNAREATILVDGERVGETPGSYPVPICAKRIEVRAGDFGWSTELALREGRNSQFDARLARLTPEPPPKGELTLTLEWSESKLRHNSERTNFFLENDRVRIPCLLDQRGCSFRELVPGSWRFVAVGGANAEKRIDLTGDGALHLTGGTDLHPGKLTIFGAGFALLAWGIGNAIALSQQEDEIGGGELALTILGSIAGLGACAGGYGASLQNSADPIALEGEGGAYVAWDPLHEWEAWMFGLQHHSGMVTGVSVTRRVLSWAGLSLLLGPSSAAASFGLIGPARIPFIFLEAEAATGWGAGAADGLRLAAVMGAYISVHRNVGLRLGATMGGNLTQAAPLFGPVVGLQYQP